MPTLRPLILAAATALLQQAAISATPYETIWTGGGGSNLWSNPANWSDGLPQDAKRAVIYTGGEFDLGGSIQPVNWLHLESDGIRIGNGTLSAEAIEYERYSPWVSPVITADLTGRNGQLHLYGSGGPAMRIEGEISGDIALGLWGGTTITTPSQHTGPTLIAAGNSLTNTLSGNGTLLKTPSFRLTGRLVLDNTSISLSDRINDAAPIELGGGRISVGNAIGSSGSERIGPIHTTGGAEIFVTGAQGEFTLRAASLTHDVGGFVAFRTDPAAGKRVLFDTAPVLIGGIIPFAGQVTYDIGLDMADASDDLGIRALSNAELATSIPLAGSPGPAPNVRLTTSQSVTGNVRVNSVSGESIVLDSANLHIESGYLASSVSGTGTVSAPGELIVDVGRLVVLRNEITAESLVLRSTFVTMAAANHLTDQIVFVGESLTIGHPEALSDAKLVMFGYGYGPYQSLKFTSGMLVANDIQFGALNPPAHPLGFAPMSAVDLVVPSNQTLTLSGNLSGARVQLVGPATSYLRLDGSVECESLSIYGFEGCELNTVLNAGRIGTDLYGQGTLYGIYDEHTASPGPRGGTGRLTIEMLTTFNYGCDLDGLVPGTEYDQIVLLTQFFREHAGYVPPTLAIDLTFAPGLGSEFLILDNQSAYLYADLFAGLPEGAIISAGLANLAISYAGGDGNDVTLTAVVPEPSYFAVVGMAAMLICRRRRSLGASERTNIG